jgi:aspartokinase-like uncharacterized kinase
LKSDRPQQHLQIHFEVPAQPFDNIVLRVYDKNKVLSDEQIGWTSISTLDLYGRDWVVGEHETFYEVLTDPERKGRDCGAIRVRMTPSGFGRAKDAAPADPPADPPASA